MKRGILAAGLLLGGWGGAAFAQAPLVNNDGGASNITATSATLNGNLTSTGGALTAVSFYWGPTDGGMNASEKGLTGSRGQ